MGPLAKLRLDLVSADPGLVGVRRGVRVTLTLGAVCLALVIIGRWIPMHSPSYVLGLITAVQGEVQVRDRTGAARALTRVYCALGAFAVIAGIAAAGNSLVLIDLLLLAVVFLAAYARRFGQRWQAVGVFSFMCGVVGSFLDAPAGDLPEIAFALVISGVVAHLAHDHVMPERPSRDLRRVVAATISLSGQLRRTISKATQRDTRWDDAVLVARRLRHDLRMCQNYLPLQVEGPGAGPNATIIRLLLDLQLAAETALEMAFTGARHRPGTDGERVEPQLDALREAEQRLEAAVAEMPASFAEGLGPAAPAPAVKRHPARGEWLEDEQFRLAIQVTLACAIAIVGGRLLSSERWFWAVMAAFLIFLNTQSGGAVVARGVSRAMGTLAGITLGIGLATIVRGDLYLTLPLVAIAVFGAFYLARISYTGLNVCINVAISLIYGLVGIFTPELLVLRLEETALGAAAGIICALAVLPVRTGHTIEQAIHRWLGSLQTLIGALLEEGRDETRKKSITAAVSAVDRAFASIVSAEAPLRIMWTLGVAGASSNTGLRRAYLLTHAAHLLEHNLRQAEPAGAEQQELRAIHERLGAVKEERVAAEPSGASAEHRLAEHLAELDIADTPVRYGIELMSEILNEVEAGDHSA